MNVYNLPLVAPDHLLGNNHKESREYNQIGLAGIHSRKKRIGKFLPGFEGFAGHADCRNPCLLCAGKREGVGAVADHTANLGIGNLPVADCVQDSLQIGAAAGHHDNCSHRSSF